MGMDYEDWGSEWKEYIVELKQLFQMGVSAKTPGFNKLELCGIGLSAFLVKYLKTELRGGLH